MGLRGKEKVCGLAGSAVSVCPSGSIIVLWWEKVCFKEERNNGKVRQDRSERGREFQMDGAAKENERWPFSDRTSGTMRRSLSKDLRFLFGI